MVSQAARKLPSPSLNPTEMPEKYAMVCDGDCMFPLYEHGQRLVFSKSAPLKHGQPGLLFRKPEATPPGENPLLFKQLVSGPSKAYWEQDAHPEGTSAQ
jgi:hypothetical protein